MTADKILTIEELKEVGAIRPDQPIRTFAIISTDNPLGVFSEDEWNVIKSAKSDDIYKSNNAELKQKLSKAYSIKNTGDTAMRYGGFDYIQINGKHCNHEITYIIFNLTPADAQGVARGYGQEDYFYGVVSKEPNTNQVGTSIAKQTMVANRIDWWKYFGLCTMKSMCKIFSQSMV